MYDTAVALTSFFDAITRKDVASCEKVLVLIERDPPSLEVFKQCAAMSKYSYTMWMRSHWKSKTRKVALLRALDAGLTLSINVPSDEIAIFLVERYPMVLSFSGADILGYMMGKLSPEACQRIIERTSCKLDGYTWRGLCFTETMCAYFHRCYNSTIAYAGGVGYIPLIRACLEKSASIKSALIGAGFKFQVDAIKWLVRQKTFRFTLKHCFLPYAYILFAHEIALEIGLHECVGLHPKRTARIIKNSAFLACLRGKLTELKSLCMSTTNPWYRSRHFIHYAVNSRSADVVHWVVETFGRDCVNLKDRDGWSPLHYACLWGDMDIIRYLLYNGANQFPETRYKHRPADLLPFKYKHHEAAMVLLGHFKGAN